MHILLLILCGIGAFALGYLLTLFVGATYFAITILTGLVKLGPDWVYFAKNVEDKDMIYKYARELFWQHIQVHMWRAGRDNELTLRQRQKSLLVAGISNEQIVQIRFNKKALGKRRRCVLAIKWNTNESGVKATHISISGNHWTEIAKYIRAFYPIDSVADDYSILWP